MSITQVVFMLSDRAMARLIGIGADNVGVDAAHQECHAQKKIAPGFCTIATRAGARIKKHRKYSKPRPPRSTGACDTRQLLTKRTSALRCQPPCHAPPQKEGNPGSVGRGKQNLNRLQDEARARLDPPRIASDRC